MYPNPPMKKFIIHTYHSDCTAKTASSAFLTSFSCFPMLFTNSAIAFSTCFACSMQIQMITACQEQPFWQHSLLLHPSPVPLSSSLRQMRIGAAQASHDESVVGGRCCLSAHITHTFGLHV